MFLTKIYKAFKSGIGQEMVSVHAPFIRKAAVSAMVQQQSGHSQITAAAGKEERGESVAFMVRLVNVSVRYPFVFQHGFYRVIEIMPYQQMEQSESVAAIYTRSQKGFCGALGDAVWISATTFSGKMS